MLDKISTEKCWTFKKNKKNVTLKSLMINIIGQLLVIKGLPSINRNSQSDFCINIFHEEFSFFIFQDVWWLLDII